MSPDLVAEAESARRARVEALTRAEPRRSWTAEQKRQIAAESLGPDLTATEVARKYRISLGQHYTCRQQLMSLPGSVVTRAPMTFAAVELATVALPSPEPPTPVAPPSPDGIGLCMLTKRLEQGQFVSPSTASAGQIALTAPQLAALLDGCDWRDPVPVRRPEPAG